MKMENIQTKEAQWILKEKYGGVESAAFLHDCERLRNGEPVDYIIGWKPFLDCRIDLSFRPLIPRPETEYWTEKIIAMIREQVVVKETLSVLDAFAGSGCIGIAIAKAFPQARVTFVDSAPQTALQIEKNCVLNTIAQERVEIVEADVLHVPLGTFDVVVANPPYIAEDGREARVALNVHQYEPHAALYGGGDGMSMIRPFTHRIEHLLNPGGLFAMEFDDIQREVLEVLFARETSIEATFHKDQYGKDRYCIAQKDD